ncbi:MAG: exosortase/archaeosortase family protein [Phycisphaerales bacterium]
MARSTGRHFGSSQPVQRTFGLKTPWSRCHLLLSLLLLFTVTVWAYRGFMLGLVREWRIDGNYSAGQLVPFVAAFLVWRERETLRRCPTVPCWWGGMVLIVLSQVTRAYGYLFMAWSGMQYAFVLTLAGLVLMVAGWQVFRRVIWVLLFMFLMFPLPESVHNAISGPLQRLATTGSVFLLEVFGTQATQQGNVVLLGDNTPMAVTEACSGLRMLTAFVIVAAFIAYMVKRPRWQKGVLLVSSIPVAVVCNMIRISLTAMIMLYVSVELGEKFFHDFAGLVMMPAAVSLIFGEIWLMDRLVVRDSAGSAGRDGDPSRAGRGSGGVVVRKRTRDQ